MGEPSDGAAPENNVSDVTATKGVVREDTSGMIGDTAQRVLHWGDSSSGSRCHILRSVSETTGEGVFRMGTHPLPYLASASA